MRDSSSSFVKVSYLNGSAILAQLHHAAQSLKRNPNVIKAYLFGSLVRGDYCPGSDADVAILLREDERRFMDRIPEFMDYFDAVEVAVDVFPYTLAEKARMESSNNAFWREIVTSGKEL